MANPDYNLTGGGLPLGPEHLERALSRLALELGAWDATHRTKLHIPEHTVTIREDEARALFAALLRQPVMDASTGRSTG